MLLLLLLLIIIIMESIYIALFQLSSKRFDTHYYPDRPGINMKPSELHGKYTVRLPVSWRLKTSKLTISCSVWYRVPFYCRVDCRGSDEIWTRELSHGKWMVLPLHHCVPHFTWIEQLGICLSTWYCSLT